MKPIPQRLFTRGVQIHPPVIVHELDVQAIAFPPGHRVTSPGTTMRETLAMTHPYSISIWTVDVDGGVPFLSNSSTASGQLFKFTFVPSLLFAKNSLKLFTRNYGVQKHHYTRTYGNTETFNCQVIICWKNRNHNKCCQCIEQEKNKKELY